MWACERMVLRRDPCAVALGVVAVLTLCHVPTSLLAFSPSGTDVMRHAGIHSGDRRAALLPPSVARRASPDGDLDFLRDFDALAAAGSPPAAAPKGPSVFELERQKEADARAAKKPTSKRAALRAALRGILDTLSGVLGRRVAIPAFDHAERDAWLATGRVRLLVMRAEDSAQWARIVHRRTGIALESSTTRQNEGVKKWGADVGKMYEAFRSSYAFSQCFAWHRFSHEQSRSDCRRGWGG